jgi:hypothetical protein
MFRDRDEKKKKKRKLYADWKESGIVPGEVEKDFVLGEKVSLRNYDMYRKVHPIMSTTTALMKGHV